MADLNQLRQETVNLMKSRIGKNQYTNGGKRAYFFGYPDNEPANVSQKGYSDCSSAVAAVYKKLLGIDIGKNTNEQIKNRKTIGIIVDETTGILPDESKLLPGDCLYFKGNKSYTLDVGHVEMYIGNNTICGHGSGTGPKTRTMTTYCKDRAEDPEKRYFMAIRWIHDGIETPPGKDTNIPANDENTVTVAGGTYFLRRGPGKEYPHDGVYVVEGEKLEKVDQGTWTPVKYKNKDGEIETRWIGASGVAK